MALPVSVAAALAALVPHDALSNAFGGRSRDPGSLSWRHELIDEPEAARLLGAAVPVLPALRAPEVVERVSVHRGLRSESLESQLAAGFLLLHLRVTYLPVDQAWEQALTWPVLRRGGSVLDVREQDPDPQRRRPWPQRVASSRDAGSGDYAVVTVEGVEVGVQVDTSGVVHLTWRVSRGSRVLLVGLLTRRGPRAAVELVAEGGLLT
ncbi:hypothetical protein [Kineococcus radiotolerans]|uniref:hypothetical protein n=1 Tax=Kineococcus radiotolerans TaxID=131568 RepID=UPI000325DB2D|nr:hypothetical protein [Kineococcus radiotolerans]